MFEPTALLRAQGSHALVELALAERGDIVIFGQVVPGLRLSSFVFQFPACRGRLSSFVVVFLWFSLCFVFVCLRLSSVSLCFVSFVSVCLF